MGIKNFTNVIKKYSPDSIINIKITDLSNKKLAIDANLMIYKSIYAIRKHIGKDITNSINGKEIKITHIYTMFFKLFGFRKYNITPIFVFDGRPHTLKFDTLQVRKDTKQIIKEKYDQAIDKIEQKKYYFMAEGITNKQIDECKKLIQLFGYSYLNSPEEADSQCAQLLKEKIVDGIVTDDSDILLFGGNNIIKNFTITTKNKMQIINLKTILKDFKFTQKQLIELGILLGSDYSKTVKGIGAITAYKLLQKYGSIKNIIKNGLIDKDYNYENVVEYFEKPKVLKNNQQLKAQNINIEMLKRYLSSFGLQNHKIINKYLDQMT
jgi:flap endonuclease-1